MVKVIEKLYFDYKQDVYNYLLCLTHDPVLSEDLLSETFVKAIISFANFKGQSSIKTWLFGIARHLWLQNLRKSRPSVEYSDLIDVYVSDGILENLITKQIAERVCELINTKDERTQKIIRLRINGISYYEISEKIGISENSARVIDFRTKKWIKSVLEKEALI